LPRVTQQNYYNYTIFILHSRHPSQNRLSPSQNIAWLRKTSTLDTQHLLLSRTNFLPDQAQTHQNAPSSLYVCRTHHDTHCMTDSSFSYNLYCKYGHYQNKSRAFNPVASGIHQPRFSKIHSLSTLRPIYCERLQAQNRYMSAVAATNLLLFSITFLPSLLTLASKSKYASAHFHTPQSLILASLCSRNARAHLRRKHNNSAATLRFQLPLKTVPRAAPRCQVRNSICMRFKSRAHARHAEFLSLSSSLVCSSPSTSSAPHAIPKMVRAHSQTYRLTASPALSAHQSLYTHTVPSVSITRKIGQIKPKTCQNSKTQARL
jgi:hypothetical protein